MTIYTESRTARWVGFSAMCLGMFMAILDIQIVVTSLPAIRDALDIPVDRMSWIQTAYLIAEVVAIPLTGFLTRCLGLRGLFLTSLTVFTLASAACAAATGIDLLIAARVVQGFAGGCLIPLVFSAVFLLFPEREQGLATTVAGALAVLAPTLGPTAGGYITETYSWPWLFLVNIGPGILALGLAARYLPREGMQPGLLARLDWVSVLLLAVGLASLEIGLKQGPEQGWIAPPVLGLLALAGAAGAAFIGNSARHPVPVVQLRLFRNRTFAIACAISFLFGIGLFSMVYLMPVFLGLVRGHSPFEIGLTMLVTGAAQLAVSPLVVQMERRFDARLLTALGLAGFAIGLAMSGFQTRQTDFDAMFWPQIVRGVSIMFCLLPPTRLALGLLPDRDIPDGSALFNLMRNLGGAIGIALVDTVLWQRTPQHAERIADGLRDRDPAAADAVGLPVEMLPPPGRDPTPEEVAFVEPLLETAGLVEAVNEAWLLLAMLIASGLLLLPAARSIPAPGRRSAAP